LQLQLAEVRAHSRDLKTQLADAADYKVTDTLGESFFKHFFISCIDYVALNSRLTVYNELGRVWNEIVIVYFKVLSQVPRGIEENRENTSVRIAS